eukprot:3279530-Rhodomonas_salina.2
MSLLPAQWAGQYAAKPEPEVRLNSFFGTFGSGQTPEDSILGSHDHDCLKFVNGCEVVATGLEVGSGKPSSKFSTPTLLKDFFAGLCRKSLPSMFSGRGPKVLITSR